MTEARTSTSPFSSLLAETGNPAPARNQSGRMQGSAPAQRSDAQQNDVQRSNAQDSQRPQEDSTAEAPEAAAAEQPDGAVADQSANAAGQVQEFIETSISTLDSSSDPAAEEVITTDAAPAAPVEIPSPSPEQPAVAATPSLAPAAPAPAALTASAAPEALSETGVLEPSPTGAIAAPVAAPAPGGEATRPELRQAQQVPQAPLAPHQAAQGEVAEAAVVPATPQAKLSVEPSVAPPVTPEQAGVSATPKAPAATPIEAPALAYDTPAVVTEHSETESSPPQQQPATPPVEKRLTTSAPQAPETAERPRTASAVSEFVQAAQPTPDSMHLAHLQTGRDFGQAVAATAHASQSADASNPLVSAPVPLESLAVEIAARAQGGRNRFEIRLDPPELGRIEVRLDIDRSGQVTSRLIVDKAETLDVLRRDAHQLERALQDAGLKTSDNSLQFSLRDQSFAERNDRNDSNQRILIADPELPAAEAAPVAYGLTLRGGSGIDIRV